jgi:hypothetical protein
VQENFVCSLITLIASTGELQNYAVCQAYHLMKDFPEQSGLSQLAIWLVGEFGELLTGGDAEDLDGNPVTISESEVIESIGSAMELYFNTTKIDLKDGVQQVIVQYGLTALSKLTVRFSHSNDEIKELMDEYTQSHNCEIQQRACEYL